MKKKILITGSAGFIGYHLVKRLLKRNVELINVDNLNNYYDINLKKKRLRELKLLFLKNNKKFVFYKVDISNKKSLFDIFNNHKPSLVINLAAQAGVRYSFVNPNAYTQSNIVGFANILEACRLYKVKKLIFASSSSIYGANKKYPFKEIDQNNSPLQYYAATKTCNEVMAYSYSNIYKIKCYGLRFFTVYGPSGRPDMAYFKFAKDILNSKKITLYNNGDHFRDFTFIDDIVDGILLVLFKQNNKKYEIYNLGRGKAESLKKMLHLLEKYLGKKALIKYSTLQKGDMYKTYASNKKIYNDYKFRPKISLQEGLKKFTSWIKK